MKRVLLILLFSSGLLWGNEDITLEKIRFVVNGEKINWKNGEDIPYNEVIGGSQPYMLMNFFKFRPGDVLTEEKLNKEIEKCGLRLDDSNLFYLSSVTVVPPRKYPDKRTVVIKVNDGYRYIWGGGSIYGFAGKRNIEGKGDSATIALGLNRAGVYYHDQSIGETQVYSDYLFIYNNDLPEKDFDKMSHAGMFEYKLGYRFTPDFSLFTGFKYYMEDSKTDVDLGFNLQNKLKFYNGNILRSELWSGYTYRLFESSSFMESEIRNKYSVGQISLNFNIAGGREIVSSKEHPFDLTDPSRNNIRSDYNLSELEGDSYFFTGIQIDKSFNMITFPPIFNIVPIISLFADVAYISSEIRDAYGPAISLYCDSPIFTSFDFSYGWNRYGEGRFTFNVSSYL